MPSSKREEHLPDFFSEKCIVKMGSHQVDFPQLCPIRMYFFYVKHCAPLVESIGMDGMYPPPILRRS